MANTNNTGTWIKLCTAARINSKILHAERRSWAACWLWVKSLLLAYDSNNNGYLDSLQVETALYPEQELVDILVEEGLWEKKDDGYLIHDYTDFQQSSLDRQGTTNRYRKAALKRWEKERAESNAMHDATHDATHKDASSRMKKSHSETHNSTHKETHTETHTSASPNGQKSVSSKPQNTAVSTALKNAENEPVSHTDSHDATHDATHMQTHMQRREEKRREEKRRNIKESEREKPADTDPAENGSFDASHPHARNATNTMQGNQPILNAQNTGTGTQGELNNESDQAPSNCQHPTSSPNPSPAPALDEIEVVQGELVPTDGVPAELTPTAGGDRRALLPGEKDLGPRPKNVDDWRPLERQVAKCSQLGKDPAVEAQKFRNYASYRAKPYKNFDRAFDNWLIRIEEEQARRSKSQMNQDLNMRMVMQAAQRDGNLPTANGFSEEDFR